MRIPSYAANDNRCTHATSLKYGVMVLLTMTMFLHARPSLQRSRFAKTTPGTRSVFPLARDGCCPHRKHAIQYVASDEILWGTSIEERHATIRREGVSATVNRNLRGERGIVESNDAADEAGAMFWYREGGVDSRRDSQDLGAAVRRYARRKVETPEEDLGKRAPEP